VGGTSNYIRGGLYLATEATLGGLWYHYSVTLYDKQVKKYESFARAHYSLSKYETNIYSLYKQIPDSTKRSNFQTLYLVDRESYCAALFQDPQYASCPSLTNVDRGQYATDSTLGGTLQSVTVWNETALYRIVGTDNFIQGWDDLDSMSTYADLELGDSLIWHRLGTSENSLAYANMRERANKLAGYQAYFLGGLLLNHIVSAVDATWSAYAHNRSLYEEKVSWLDRVHLQSGFQWNNGPASQIIANVEF